MIDEKGKEFIHVFPEILYSNIKSSSFRVWCYLKMIDGQYLQDFPGITKIAACCKISRNTVITSLNELEENGFIKMIKNGAGLANEYMIFDK